MCVEGFIKLDLSYWFIQGSLTKGLQRMSLLKGGFKHHIQELARDDGSSNCYIRDVGLDVGTCSILKKFQQTPGTYTRPSTTCVWRKSFRICILECLGYVPVFLEHTSQTNGLIIKFFLFNGCLSYHRDHPSTSHTTIPIFRLVKICVFSTSQRLAPGPKSLATFPRHPNTPSEGIWTPKTYHPNTVHLRRYLDV